MTIFVGFPLCTLVPFVVQAFSGPSVEAMPCSIYND
jgi:hypothetical protein